MQLYEVPGIRINDSWYCREGDTYHAFFLQYPEDGPMDNRQFTDQTVGHAFSDDLYHWTYTGTVLTALPDTWNDMGIATGSTVFYGGKWYILYSGNSRRDKGGFGLAVSTDLLHWEKVGDAPVISRNVTYPFSFEGKEIRVDLLADPYIYPEPFDGWFYAYINAHIVGEPVNDRGVQAVMKSRDLLHWEPHTIACRDRVERIETAQVWEREGRYYMYGGTVINRYRPDGSFDYQEMTNRFYVSDKPDRDFSVLHDFSPDCYFYIAKVLKDPEGRDVLLGNNIPRGAIGPYPLRYHEKGITLLPSSGQKD